MCESMFLCVCESVLAYLHATCGEQRTENLHDSICFAIWVLRVRLKSSGLAASTFTH